MTLNDTIRALRRERGMTQEQLAMLLGVSRQAISKWESEKAYPEMDKLLMLCGIAGRRNCLLYTSPSPRD